MALSSVEVLRVDDRPYEPDGFREFVEARSGALLRSGWLLTGEWPSAEDLVQTARLEGAGPAAGRARAGRTHDRRCGLVNTEEERQLAEMLHRVTPEPPRRMTVEDVADRVASEPQREPRPRRGSFWHGVFREGHGWTPVLAALSVFAIAGASAGIATVATSHHGRTGAPGDGTPPATATISGSPSPAAPSQSPPRAGKTLRVAGGMWDARLINRDLFSQGSLTGSGGSLYAVEDGALARIDPATGVILQTTPYNPPVFGRPVVAGNTVWVVWSYGGGEIVLRGYDARTLAQVASVPVPAAGGVSNLAQGVLAAGPDGQLYVAAGETVATVDPAARRVTHRIDLTAGRASSVAVSPDGSKLYVGSAPSRSFQLLVYDLATRIEAFSSRISAGGTGNLLATAGGVWGTTGTGMSQWVWFAPGGDLSRSFRVGQGAGGGLASLPSYSGGVVWVGGTHELVCASPATGQALARTPIPADHGAVEYFDSVTVLGSGRTYALYQDSTAQLAGLARLTPPREC